MPYPSHLINEGETVVLDEKPHWWYFSKHILTGIPLFVLLVIVLAANGTPAEVARYVVGVAAILWACWLVGRFVKWQFTYFVVTDMRVIYRSGVISKTGVEIPHERINNINFRQGIWERVIGAGTLEMQSAGEAGTSSFTDVRHPDAVQQEIYRQMESDAKRRASWVMEGVRPAAGDVSVPEQIRQLAELRDAGHISADEYETKKAQLLGRM